MGLVDKFAEHYDVGRQIIQSLVGFSQHCADSKLYSAGTDACAIHADTFNNLRASTRWLSTFFIQAHDNAPHMIPEFESTLEAVLRVALPIFKDNVPDVVAFAAMRLLRSLFEQIHSGVVIRTLARVSGAPDTFALLGAVLDRYSLPVQEEIVTAICQSLLVAEYGAPPAWDAREREFASVVGPICTTLISLSAAAAPGVFNVQESVAIVHRAASILAALIKAVRARGYGKASTEIASRQILPTFGATLSLLSHCSHNLGLLERLVSFHLEALETFSATMDAGSIETVVQSYLTLLQAKDNLEAMFSGQDKTRVMLAAALMRMLEAIVKLPFSPLVGSLITYGIESIAPALKKSPSPTALFHFYFAAVSTHANEINNAEVVAAIYADFLWALEQQDVETYRTVLIKLEDLGRRKDFFMVHAFKERFFNPYIGTLVRTLINRAHHLLWEQIADVLWLIVKREHEHFYHQTLPQLFQSPVFGSISTAQQQSLHKNFGAPLDLMGFRRSIEIVIDDCSYFMRTNNPVPQM